MQQIDFPEKTSFKKASTKTNKYLAGEAVPRQMGQS